MIYRFSSSFFCLFLASSFLNVESFTVASFPSFFFFLILAADSPLADDSRGTFRHFVRVFHFICFVFFYSFRVSVSVSVPFRFASATGREAVRKKENLRSEIGWEESSDSKTTKVRTRLESNYAA